MSTTKKNVSLKECILGNDKGASLKVSIFEKDDTNQPGYTT